jgi:hypothetical protein
MDYFLPAYMQDPIDYYLTHKIKPRVIRYDVNINPILNGLFIDHVPILYEEGDHLELKYSVQRSGNVPFNEYMQFLHEAYKCSNLNIENNYSGSWSFKF